jgi:hypothetical protein
MTLAAISLRSVPSRARHIPSLTRTGRLIRLEVRRNAMRWMLPVVAALFWLDAYRAAMALPPFWAQRAMHVEMRGLIDFAPLGAAAAAWMGSRDGRRRTTGMVSVTARPRWGVLLITWSATAGWAVAAYLSCVAAVYLATSRQATWGGPLWWPVVVGAATVVAACAIGFTAGVLRASRFTAPLVAVVVFGAFFAALRPLGGNTYALISPVNSTLGLNLFPDIAVFQHYLPDLSIDQVMVMAGLTAVCLGALGLPVSSGGRWLRRVAVIAAVAGLAAVGTAVGLAGTARLDAHGMMTIPALHDAASDGPVSYRPVCDHAALPICVQPAFQADLPDVAAAVNPLLSEVSGLPGAPVRVIQVATVFHLNSAGLATPAGPSADGNPAVVRLPLGQYIAAQPAVAVESVRLAAAPVIVASVVGGTGTPAQQAVQAALLNAAGIPLVSQAQADAGQNGVPGPAPGSAVYSAAMRFASLPAPARHSWLAAHASMLRAGRITLEELP